MVEYIVILFLGIVMVVIALHLYHKRNRIKKNGLKTEGVVYELFNNPSSSINTRNPVIRFLTMDQQWITEASDIGMFPGFYKKGQKVSVVYDRENPKQFIIDSKINSLIVYVILIAGSSFILFGAYKLL